MTAFTDEDVYISTFNAKLHERIRVRRLAPTKATLRVYLDAARVIATNIAGPALIVGVGAMLWVAL